MSIVQFFTALAFACAGVALARTAWNVGAMVLGRGSSISRLDHQIVSLGLVACGVASAAIVLVLR